MTQAYTDWLKCPESERNAEAATVVMGWVWNGGCWSPHDKAHMITVDVCIAAASWSPCTDRNATDMLLAEVERRGLSAMWRFIEAAIDVEQLVPAFALLRAPASLLTWACVEACREEA